MTRRSGSRRLLAAAVTAVAVISAGTLQLGGTAAWAAAPTSPESPGELLVPQVEEGSEQIRDPDGDEEALDPGSGEDCEVTDAAPDESAFEVTAIDRDRVPRHARPALARSARDDRVSIPPPDEANAQQRYFGVDYTLPAGVELTCVRVDLLDTSPKARGAVLQTVTQAAPTADGGEGVKSVGRGRLKVRVTFDEQHLQGEQQAVAGDQDRLPGQPVRQGPGRRRGDHQQGLREPVPAVAAARRDRQVRDAFRGRRRLVLVLHPRLAVGRGRPGAAAGDQRRLRRARAQPRSPDAPDRQRPRHVPPLPVRGRGPARPAPAASTTTSWWPRRRPR
ncbi:hypothetical protein ACFQ0B_50785 [Nonomuraea thailandensis]